MIGDEAGQPGIAAAQHVAGFLVDGYFQALGTEGFGGLEAEVAGSENVGAARAAGGEELFQPLSGRPGIHGEHVRLVRSRQGGEIAPRSGGHDEFVIAFPPAC